MESAEVGSSIGLENRGDVRVNSSMLSLSAKSKEFERQRRVTDGQ